MSLKYAILALLSHSSQTGYELTHSAEGSTGFFWSATHQQIYKDLAALEKEGWVKFKSITQSNKPDKKIYSLTRNGAEALKNWISEETDLPPSKDPFLIKIFAGQQGSPKILLSELLRLREIHQARRKKYLAIEEQHFQKPEQLELKMRFQYLTLRRGLLFEEAWLKWSKEVESFLKNARSSE